MIGSAWPAVLVHLLLSTFPTGRLTTRARGCGLCLFLPGLLLVLLLGDAEVIATCNGPCPENVIQIVDADAVADALLTAASLLVALLCVAVVVVLVVRRRRAGPAMRRAREPIYAVGVVLLGGGRHADGRRG